MSEIRIEQNICADSGGGWSHHQRPDPSGRHICVFEQTARVSNVSIINNIFYQSKVPGGMVDERRWGDATLGWGDSIARTGTCGFRRGPIWEPDRGGRIVPKVLADVLGCELSPIRITTGNGEHSLLADPLLAGLTRRRSQQRHRPVATGHVACDRQRRTDNCRQSASRSHPDIGAFEHARVPTGEDLLARKAGSAN